MDLVLPLKCVKIINVYVLPTLVEGLVEIIVHFLKLVLQMESVNAKIIHVVVFVVHVHSHKFASTQRVFVHQILVEENVETVQLLKYASMVLVRVLQTHVEEFVGLVLHLKNVLMGSVTVLSAHVAVGVVTVRLHLSV